MKETQGSILPEDIMNQICDITEADLKRKKIPHTRSGTSFSTLPVFEDDILQSQIYANKVLLKKGVLTIDMLMADFLNAIQ